MSFDLRSKLDLHRRERFLCDVTIIVNGASFPAHKFVLAASCDFFSQLFLTQPVKQNGDTHEKDEFVLTGLRGIDFEPILHFLYTAKLDCDPQSVLDILYNVQVLNIRDAVDKCIVYLSENLTIPKCIGVYKLAKEQKYYPLFSACETFVLRNFEKIALEEPSFIDMDFSFLLRLISNDECNSRNELMVFRAAVKWVAHDLEERNKYLSHLICQCRVPLIEPCVLTKEINNQPNADLKSMLKNCVSRAPGDEDKDHMDVMKEYNNNCAPSGLIDKDTWLCLQNVPRRSYRETILMIGGVSEYRNNIVDWVERWDTFRNTWEAGGKLMRPRSGHCLVRYIWDMYLVGGQSSSDEILNTVDFCQVKTRERLTWKKYPHNMVTPRKWFGAGCIDGYVYVFGGYSTTGPLDTIEMINLKSKTPEWRVIGKLPVAKFSFSATYLRGLVYVAGGVVNNAEVGTLEVYHPGKGDWYEACSMGEPRSQLSLVAIEGCLYAIGGRNSTSGVLNVVEKYCSDKNTWTKVCPMFRKRAGATAVTHNACIYVFGGRAHSDRQNLDFGEVFDPLANHWTLLEQGPTNRSYATATVVL